jgi:predicted Zn-dependent protease
MSVTQLDSCAPASFSAAADDGLSSVITSDEIRLLAAIGFLAGKSGCAAPAIRIFQSLITLRPRSEFPYIGLSIAYMAVGMNTEAVHALTERACNARTQSDSLELWRSLAFHLAGSRSLAAASLQKYSEDISVNVHTALVDKLSGELGLRATQPDWPLPAMVSDRVIALK